MKSRKEETILSQHSKKRDSVTGSAYSKNSSLRGSNRTARSVNRVNNYVSLYKNETSSRQAKRPQSRDTRRDENNTSNDNSMSQGIRLSESRKSMLKNTLIIATKLNSQKTAAKLDRTNAQIKAVSYEIQKARSDRLELRRDLATYEYNFGSSIDLKPRLVSLKQESLNLPDVSDIVTKVDNEEKEMIKILKQSVMEMQDIEVKYTQLENQVANPVPITESYSLRNTKDVEELFNIYQGVDNISSQRCIVKIRGDLWLEKVEIAVETLQKQQFFLSLRLNITNSYVEPKDVKKIIKQRLIPRLYISANTKNFTLQYDPEHGKKYLCILVNIKNWKLTSIYLSQKDNFIILSANNEVFNFKLDQGELDGIPLTFQSMKKLSKLIENKLCYIPEPNVFTWNSENYSNFPFRLKEEKSKLLDNKYLQEVFQLSQYVLASKLKLRLMESKFVIKVYKSKNRFKIFISAAEEVMEINSGTRIYNLLVDLQFKDISKASVTLLKSLELKLVLRKSFPNLFNIS
jgi:hypothetical protein